MSRSTVYNKDLVTKEKWDKVLEQNKTLLEDFVDYLSSSNKSPQTIYQYRKQLEIFFVWNMEKNGNKFFVDVKKREYMKFFGHLNNELGLSSNRISSLRAVLSSISNFIERILDDEYPTFRNLVKVLEAVPKSPVREKTILSNEQIDAALEALVEQGKYQIACALAVGAASGARKAEIIQMRVDDFKSENIKLGCMYETGKIRTKGKGKEGKIVTRLVFQQVVDKYLKLWLEEREKQGIKSEWLFVTYKNGSYEQAQIPTMNSWAKKIGSIIGEEFYFHSLRHYMVTDMKRKGFPESVIQKIIRWSSISMVAIYNDMEDTEELAGFFANFNGENKKED